MRVHLIAQGSQFRRLRRAAEAFAAALGILRAHPGKKREIQRRPSDQEKKLAERAFDQDQPAFAILVIRHHDPPARRSGSAADAVIARYGGRRALDHDIAEFVAADREAALLRHTRLQAFLKPGKDPDIGLRNGERGGDRQQDRCTDLHRQRPVIEQAQNDPQPDRRGHSGERHQRTAENDLGVRFEPHDHAAGRKDQEIGDPQAEYRPQDRAHRQARWGVRRSIGGRCVKRQSDSLLRVKTRILQRSCRDATAVGRSVAGPQGTGSSFSSRIFSRHFAGASVWTLLPRASTATVTGMFSTVNS